MKWNLLFTCLFVEDAIQLDVESTTSVDWNVEVDAGVEQDFEVLIIRIAWCLRRRIPYNNEETISKFAIVIKWNTLWNIKP